MKKLVCAVFAVAVLSSPAFAAPFTGGYIGAEIGYDHYEVKAEDVFGGGESIDGLSGNGLVGGVFAGYDLPLGSNAFGGVEASLNTSGAKITASDGIDTLTVKAKESYGISGRVGMMLNDSTGIYGRFGWENTKFKASVGGDSESETEDGWRYGAGVETRVGSNASLRIEYNIVDYGNTLDTDAKNYQVRGGIAFRF